MNTKDFTRNRSLTFVHLGMFIINFVRKSLQIELYNFADLLNIPSVTKQAFSKARKKLSPKVFQLLNEKFLEEFYTDNIIKTFKDLRIIAVDGSTLRLPISTELYISYGNDKINNSIPMARTSVLFDTLNHIAIHASLAPYNTSETISAIEHINKLIEQNEIYKDAYNDLLIFDRGYASIFLMFFLIQNNKHFLMRIKENYLTETNIAIKSGLIDSVVTLSTFSKNRTQNPNFEKYLPNLDKNTKLQARVLVFELNNGNKEYIITSLVNKSEFSYDDIFKLYGIRWNIEEGYKFYKSIAEIENFSGKSQIAIEQDFYATIFSCNLSALLMQEAQDELNEIKKLEGKEELKYEYKVNRNILIGIVKNEIIEIFLSDQDINAYCEKLKNRIKQNLIPIRPDRKFPRIFKRGKNKINRRAL